MHLLWSAGAMGPIPGEDMERWLLHGVPPKQLGRAIHRPVLEATAADLLVCGLLPGEVEKNLKPGELFKCRSLLPGRACRLVDCRLHCIVLQCVSQNPSWSGMGVCLLHPLPQLSGVHVGQPSRHTSHHNGCSHDVPRLPLSVLQAGTPSSP